LKKSRLTPSVVIPFFKGANAVFGAEHGVHESHELEKSEVEILAKWLI